MSNKARINGVADETLSATVASIIPAAGMEPKLAQITSPSRTQGILYKSPGEMALQGFQNAYATACAPQKLVHLVGCRDPNVRSDLPWRRPRRTA